DPAASAIRQKLHVTGQDSEVLVTLRLVSLSGIRVRARLQGGSLLRGAGIRVAAIHPGESGQDVARRLPSPLQVPVLSQNPGFHEVPPGRYLASLVSGSHVVHSEEVN